MSSFGNITRIFIAMWSASNIAGVASSLAHKYVHNRRHIYKSLVVGVIVSIFVMTMSYLGHFREQQVMVTHVFQTLFGKQEAEEVALVLISPWEYQQEFGGVSPLDKDKLATFVRYLVSAKVRAIGLDFDIQSSESCQDNLLESLEYAKEHGVPVVLAESSQVTLPADIGCQRGSRNYQDPNPYGPHHKLPELDYPAVSNDVGLPDWLAKKNYILHGPAQSYRDKDMVWRRASAYFFEINTKKKDGIGPDCARIRPSFALALAAASRGVTQEALVSQLKTACRKNQLHQLEIDCPKTGLEAEAGREPTANPCSPLRVRTDSKGFITPTFIGNYEHFRYVTCMSDLASGFSDSQEVRNGQNGGPGVFGKNHFLYDKVVLVGGTYDGQDFHLTPVGTMSGVEVWANVVESLLSGTTVAHVSHWLAFALEIVLGAVVAVVFGVTSRGMATVICLAGLIPLVVLASLLVFHINQQWLDFLPTTFGVMLHNWVVEKDETLRSWRKRRQGRKAGETSN